MTNFISISRWDSQFLHRDLRRASGRLPWVLNRTALIHEDAYLELSLATRGFLHGLLLLAAERDNKVDASTLLLSSRLWTPNGSRLRSKVEVLKAAGFIEAWCEPVTSADDAR